ncbi:MAG: selenocysteine-specific translation elongation factor [Pirellulales bacterium]|nr:selenocysteine-specific translation elongation factor [Pirellulales bacterium]
MQQVNITLGTAGHIDHGKTALVRCLTGCETDRLKEEKERGMSIDLGFAPCKIADMQVGIVDVPGHENFIKTMVAGVSGMDGVIFVVAADDGVMPQTREHLEILTLLGVWHGIVALTKIDRVEPDARLQVQADIAAFLRGTFLENAPILPLSNISGEGFDGFLEALWELVKSIEPKRVDGLFRLPLDRAFSVQGYGTVVAGIPISGSAHAGDEMVLLPHNLTGKLRRIEVYGQTSDAVMAGQCAAINVGHWDHRIIRRGDTLTVPGYFAPQEWFLCSFKLLPREKLVLKSGAEVKFHTGTTEVAASFYPLTGNFMESGTTDLVQLRTKTPIVAGPGDPFILRTPSPVRTIGGGRIVEAIERRMKGSRPGVMEDLRERAQAVPDDRRFVEYCVRRSESLAANESDLALRTKLPRLRLREILARLSEEKTIFSLAGGLFVHRQTADEAAENLVEQIRRFHLQSPERPGIPWEDLRKSTPAPRAVLDHLVAELIGAGRLVERGQYVALSEHRSTFQDEDAKLLEAVETLYRQAGFQPPSAEDVADRANVSPNKLQKILKILVEHGRLARVEEGMLFHREAVDRARELLREHFGKEERLESVQFKYLLDSTRKYAIPLLDYMDKIGVTRRAGNTRYSAERK